MWKAAKWGNLSAIPPALFSNSIRMPKLATTTKTRENLRNKFYIKYMQEFSIHFLSFSFFRRYFPFNPKLWFKNKIK